MTLLENNRIRLKEEVNYTQQQRAPKTKQEQHRLQRQELRHPQRAKPKRLPNRLIRIVNLMLRFVRFVARLFPDLARAFCENHWVECFRHEEEDEEPGDGGPDCDGPE